MTSRAKAEANRANARRSTGPRSAAGKQRSALNALKHGLTSERAVLPAEDRGAHERLRADLWARHGPEGEAEGRCLDDICVQYAKLARLAQAETGAWNAHWDPKVWPRRPAFGAVVEGLAHETIGLGAAVKAGVMTDLVRLSLYEQRIRRALEKAEAQLARLQAARRAALALSQGEAAVQEAALAEAEALLEGVGAVEDARQQPPAPRQPYPDDTAPALPAFAAPASPRAPRLSRLGRDAQDDWMLAPDLAPAPAAPQPDQLDEVEPLLRAETARLDAETPAGSAA